MTVRVNGICSTPLPVNAGAPQGSDLGCYYMFNIKIDELEENSVLLDVTAPVQAEAHSETNVRTDDDFPTMSTPSRVSYQANPAESLIAGRDSPYSLGLPTSHIGSLSPKIQSTTVREKFKHKYLRRR